MSIALLALGIAAIGYGVTVMMVGSGTWFFAVWYALGALLVASGVAVHTGAWAALPEMARHITVGCVMVLGVAFTVTVGFISTGFTQQAEDNLDYLIVLGAQVRDDRPSAVLRYRLDAACDYLERNPRTKCIVSGGQGFNEPTTEAAAMAAYLEGRGIGASRIITENRSLNTDQNIANSMAFFRPQTARVGIVTNNFHVFRATGIARKKGIAHVCGIPAYSDAWYLPNNVLRESLGVAKDLVSGNL